MGPSKFLIIFLLQIRCSSLLSQVELPFLLRLCFYWVPTPFNIVTSSSDSFSLYCIPPLFNLPLQPHIYQCSIPTAPHRLHLQASSPSSTHFITPLSALFPPSHVLGCSCAPPDLSYFSDSLRVLQWNAGGL